MATELHELTDGAWTDLGATPCYIESGAGNTADGPLATGGAIGFVFAASEPALDAPYHTLNGMASTMATLTLGGNVWARALNGRGALALVSR